MKIELKKVKAAFTAADGIGDNMWKTHCHRPAIWGVFVDGVEKVRLMGGGAGWNVLDPITLRNIINRTFDSRKEAFAATKKMLER